LNDLEACLLLFSSFFTSLEDLSANFPSPSSHDLSHSLHHQYSTSLTAIDTFGECYWLAIEHAVCLSRLRHNTVPFLWVDCSLSQTSLFIPA